MRPAYPLVCVSVVSYNVQKVKSCKSLISVVCIAAIVDYAHSVGSSALRAISYLIIAGLTPGRHQVGGGGHPYRDPEPPMLKLPPSLAFLRFSVARAKIFLWLRDFRDGWIPNKRVTIASGDARKLRELLCRWFGLHSPFYRYQERPFKTWDEIKATPPEVLKAEMGMIHLGWRCWICDARISRVDQRKWVQRVS